MVGLVALDPPYVSTFFYFGRLPLNAGGQEHRAIKIDGELPDAVARLFFRVVGALDI